MVIFDPGTIQKSCFAVVERRIEMNVIFDYCKRKRSNRTAAQIRSLLTFCGIDEEKMFLPILDSLKKNTCNSTANQKNQANAQIALLQRLRKTVTTSSNNTSIYLTERNAAEVCFNLFLFSPPTTTALRQHHRVGRTFVLPEVARVHHTTPHSRIATSCPHNGLKLL